MQRTRISRSGTLCATAGLILCGMAAQATAANLLINPGFELPTQPGSPAVDDTALGWTLIPGIQRAPFANHTGNVDPALKASPAGLSMWVKSFIPTGGRVEQAVNINSGSNYSFSNWVFFEPNYPTLVGGDPTDPTSVPAIKLTVGIEWFDGSGVAVGTPSTRVIDNADTTTFGGPTPQFVANRWQQVAFNAIAPAGAATAKVFGSWINGGGGQQISAFLDDFVMDGPGSIAPPSWNVNGSGDWNNGGNWSTGNVPNAIGAVAILGTTITSAQTVFSNTAITVGTLRFNNANTYVVAGAGSLTMDVSGGNATFDVLQGSHKVNLPLRLNDNTTASVVAGATLTIADPLTLANGSTLTKTGAGTLEIISTVNTLSAGVSAISTSGGTTNLRFQMAAGTGLANSATGTTRTFTTQRVSAVNITGGTVAIDSDGAAKVLVTDALTITGSSKLDVGDNGLIVRSGDAAAIRAAITTGRVAGGNGIVTTASTVNRGVGYATSAQLGNTGTFMGEAFTGAAVLVRYTLLGDSNLGGTVEFQDLVSLAQNYNGTGKDWFQGDFDYDGDVDFQDLIPLAQNYNGAILDDGELAALGGGDFAADWALAQSLVPEPTTLSALGAMATLALRRRR